MPRLAATARERQDRTLLDFVGEERDCGGIPGQVFFIGSSLVATTGDGSLAVVDDQSATRAFRIHDGPILAAATSPSGDFILTGGADGKLVRTRMEGEPAELAQAVGWIDAVAVSPSGLVAWASRKTVFVRDVDGAVSEILSASSCRSLAFSPDGRRLAVALYGGVMLVEVEQPNPRKWLRWDGAHLKVAWSPDARFVVSSMLENELHIWSLDDGRDARLGVYPSRVSSFCWSPDSLSMAAAGAPSVVIWPFDGETGPIGRSARVSAMQPSLVSAVAFASAGKMVAAGHRDGSILFFDLASDESLRVRRADGKPIVGLAFDLTGRRFGYASENGAIGVIVLEDPA